MCRGWTTFSPSLVVTKAIRPMSMPTAAFVGGMGDGSVTSTANEAKYRPEESRLTVMVVGSIWVTSIFGHDQMNRMGSFILASFSTPSLKVNAERVYSALCLPLRLLYRG